VDEVGFFRVGVEVGVATTDCFLAMLEAGVLQDAEDLRMKSKDRRRSRESGASRDALVQASQRLAILLVTY